MAGLNVAEWTPEQVAEWLSGLGPAVAQYVPALRARALGGSKLLTLRCDDLEYLGVHVIGHQELMLEAVEHLRNFQYELSRECIQQLALRVCVCASSVVRSVRAAQEPRLDTQALADVARAVAAVKPLASWLAATPELASPCDQLLRLALEAATCAMRDRWSEQPARCVAAACGAAAAAAGDLVRCARDPRVLQPAVLHSVQVRPRRGTLGFSVRRSPAGHLQLCSVKFGSAAHASTKLHAGDELVQVGGACVLGWEAEEAERRCAGAAREPELTLRLRRRAPRPPPAALPRRRRDLAALLPPAVTNTDSEPASPTHPTHEPSDLYPLKPLALAARRHSVSGGSPTFKRHLHTIDPFWQQLKERRRALAGSGAPSPEPDDIMFYARDKAVSYSTGLELPARPRTCAPCPPDPVATPPAEERGARGRLDKAYSTPAYDTHEAAEPAPRPDPLLDAPTTPEYSPTVVVHSAAKADQILEFKKSSSVIGEAMQQRRNNDDTDTNNSTLGTGVRDESTTEKILETINIAMMEHRRRSLLEGAKPPEPARPNESKRDSNTDDTHTTRYIPARGSGQRSPPPPSRAPTAPAPCELPVLRAVPRPSEVQPTSPMKPIRPLDATQISVPLRHITKHDIRMLPTERRELPAINTEPSSPATPTTAPRPAPAPTPTTPSSSPGDIVMGSNGGIALSPTSAVRGIFPTSKSRSLKKKSSILAKRRCVPYKAVMARGAAGAVWQRVRARAPAAAPRWVRRQLLLTHNLLYAYKTPECSRASCMVYLAGYTAAAAGEVKSRAHAFKVYHTGNAFYFACDTRDAMLAWIQLIHRATLLPLLHMDVSRQFSETEYSETESDTESSERRSDKDKERDKDRERDKDKDKSKFGSLKKLTGRVQRSESQENVSHSSTSLDRKYLRFFSRHKSKDDTKPKSKQSIVPVPTEHYRSYRRVAPPTARDEPGGGAGGGASELRASKKIPKPINYIHASNPNLLDFEKSDFVTKPTLQVPSKPKVSKPESLAGLVTLEQFMLQKQEEERRQLYSNRALRGLERDRQRQDTIVPDVIYGEVSGPDVPVPVLEAASSPPAPCSPAAPAPGPGPAPAPANPRYKEPRPEPGKGKPISVKGKDGYEKIVYPDETSETSDGSVAESYVPLSYGVAAPYGVARERRPAPAPPPAPERWRDSLRRNDKVHSTREAASKAAPVAHTAAHDTWSGAGRESTAGPGRESSSGPGVSRLRLMFTHTQPPLPPQPPAAQGGGVQYPHLQCPPTFQPSSYSLASHRRHTSDMS